MDAFYQIFSRYLKFFVFFFFFFFFVHLIRPITSQNEASKRLSR